MPWQRWTAYLVAVVAVLAGLAASVVALRWPETGALVEVAVGSVVLLPAVGFGVALATVRPTNVVGLLLALVGAVPIVIVLLGDAYQQAHALEPDALPVSPWVAFLAAGAWMWLYLPGALLMLVFPDGRPLGRRWRAVGVALVTVPVLFEVLVGLLDREPDRPYPDVPVLGPESVPDWLGAVASVLPLVFMALLVASAASMVARRRRTHDVAVRAQLRWFALGALMLPATLLLCWVSYLVLGTSDLVVIGLLATPLVLTVATAIALLRYDLYDVDRAFSAAITVGVIGTVLLAVYTAVEVVVGLTIGGRSPGAAAAATAACALALSPLRPRVASAIGRRIYPARAQVLVALGDLRRRIEDGSAAPEDLEPVLRAALAAPQLRVGYQVPGRGGLVDRSGAPFAASPSAVPVELSGTRIGVLVPGPTTSSAALLREVAREVATVVEVTRLRLDLAVALNDVAESRRRLLLVGYDERRRLERDLHDGAQQRLVSLGISLRLAQSRIADSDPELDGLLEQAVAELQTSVSELRALSHGLRPAALGDGLAAALSLLAAAVPLSVSLETDCDDVPDDVATTAYYVAGEALANVVKHAGAATVTIRARRSEGSLDLVVQDDGRGGARPSEGTGLTGLADRVAAAGGRLAVESSGQGTTVRAVIPCVS
ncbi:MAG: two-component sensor histidine kinase [Frankiales bacterium]|nr:two-component sensor histidine kinase [Frankiales bacterium]